MRGLKELDQRISGREDRAWISKHMNNDIGERAQKSLEFRHAGSMYRTGSDHVGSRDLRQ